MGGLGGGGYGQVLGRLCWMDGGGREFCTVNGIVRRCAGAKMGAGCDGGIACLVLSCLPCLAIGMIWQDEHE